MLSLQGSHDVFYSFLPNVLIVDTLAVYARMALRDLIARLPSNPFRLSLLSRIQLAIRVWDGSLALFWVLSLPVFLSHC
jgi:hypothetical protein